ncbi:MAG: hypothetical protein ACXVLM_22335 [Ilumatobacteraceae bacterium]
MSYEHVILDCGGPFATVTLNRPEKRNALALDVMSRSATTHDAQEGIAAFLEKRKATYTDRPGIFC